MANFAFGSSPDQMIPFTLAMTGLTVGHSVNPGQRKATLGMFGENVHSWLPIERCVTLAAVIAELSAMMVGVAVGTGGPDMGKDRIGVAATTGGTFVGGIEPKPGVIMIERQ